MMNFDLLSFIFGIAAGFLLWVVVSLVRNLIPSLGKWMLKQFTAWQEKNSVGIEKEILDNALARAQGSHLTRAIFELDQIIIPPRIIPPPKSRINSKNIPVESLIDGLIPHISDHTELISQIPLNTIGISEALQNGVNCFLMGSAGSGKTCALAFFVSEIVKARDIETDITAPIPIYLHANDLRTRLSDEQDPLNILIEIINGYLPANRLDRLQKYFDQSNEKKKLLILDGLDEISPVKHAEYTHFLQKCMDEIPMLQIVTTSTQDYFGELLTLQFTPYVLAHWNQAERQEFLRRWKLAWSTIRSDKKSQSAQENTHHLSSAWLNMHHKLRSPLEWTLLLWASHSGDLNGTTTAHALEAYFDRITKNILPRSALENIAFIMIMEEVACLTTTQIENIIAIHQSTNHPQDKLMPLEFEDDSGIGETGNRHKDKEPGVTSRPKVINFLVEAGLLTEYPHGFVGFQSPLLAGYLASHHPDAIIDSLGKNDLWSGKLEMIRFFTSRQNQSRLVHELLQGDNRPQHKELLLASRWLKISGNKQTWRTALLEKLTRTLVSSKTTRAVKIKIITALIMSGEPAIDTLLSQLLALPDPEVNFVAALGHITQFSKKSHKQLLKFIENGRLDVQIGSVLAICLQDHPTTGQFCENLLKSGTEEQRVVIAEVYSQRGEAGKARLLELLESDDLLTRRAALAGLSKILDNGVLDEIEKTMQRDAQWVIRNYAAKIVDAANSPEHVLSAEKLPESFESPWLISYASKLGLGISPGIPPIEVLVHCVQHGDPNERIGAMEYLRAINDPDIKSLFQNIFETADEPVREMAELNLWYLHDVEGTDYRA